MLGWRYAMFIPAVLSILMGLILIERLRDVPRTLGLPSVEDYKNRSHHDESPDKKVEHATEHPCLKVREMLFQQVLSNKYVWIFSISYFFIYVVRTAINDWTIFYLPEAKHMEYSLAKWGVFWFEAGGFAGMIIAGWGSDYFWKGNRVPVMVICSIGLVLSLLGLKYTALDMPYVDMLCLTMIGAFVFGPQMIVGLAAAEFVDKRAAATSNGFAGTLGYFGAAFAGAPIGIMIDSWGWDGFFAALLVSSAVIIALLLPLWRSEGLIANKMGWSPKRQVEEKA
jgi:OPA family sugar phosphate sensor protein UhpC-like MFS transporter